MRCCDSFAGSSPAQTGCAWADRGEFEQQDGKYDFEKEGGEEGEEDGEGGEDEEKDEDADGEDGGEEEDEDATRNLPRKRPYGKCQYYCDKSLPSVYNVFNNIHLLTVASSPLHKPCFVPIQEGARYQAFWHSYEVRGGHSTGSRSRGLDRLSLHCVMCCVRA